VVGEVEHLHPRVRQRQVVLGPVGLDQLVLGDPVELAAERHRVADEPLEHVAPLGDDPLGLVVGVVVVATNRSTRSR
jgi:hypothetical protein